MSRATGVHASRSPGMWPRTWLKMTATGSARSRVSAASVTMVAVSRRSAWTYPVESTVSLVSRARACAITRASLSAYTTRHSGADVKELTDPGLGRQVANRAGQEITRRPRFVEDAGEDFGDLVAGLLVNQVEILTAQPVAPGPGGMRHPGVEAVHQVFFRLTPGKRHLIGHVRSPPVCGCHRYRRHVDTGRRMPRRDPDGLPPGRRARHS